MELTAYNYAPPNQLSYSRGFVIRRLYTWGGWRCRFTKGEPRIYPPLRYFKHQVVQDVPQIAFNNTPFPDTDLCGETGMKFLTPLFNECILNFDGTVSGQYASAAYSKTYSKFMESVFGEQSELGVSVAEGREAIASIVDRATRLRRAYQALRRGRFRDFLKQLGGRPKEKHKHTYWTRPKDAASLWLEYWLGWAPLAGDIYNSAQVLASPDFFPEVRIAEWSSVKLPTSHTHRFGDHVARGTVTGTCKCGMGLKVKVDNPNAYLAARLGLHNPLTIAWAVVPFSFVIDWFANIGTILDSMLFKSSGVSYSDGWISINNKAWGACQSTYTYTPTRQAQWETMYAGFYSRRALIGRPPRVPLVVKLPPGLSPSRGATAISLLVAIFTKG